MGGRGTVITVPLPLLFTVHLPLLLCLSQNPLSQDSPSDLIMPVDVQLYRTDGDARYGFSTSYVGEDYIPALGCQPLP